MFGSKKVINRARLVSSLARFRDLKHPEALKVSCCNVLVSTHLELLA